MTKTIAIKFDTDGLIINRYIGVKEDDSWTHTDESEWPDDESGDDEVPRYYYDSDTGDISIEYETIATDEV